MFTGIIETIGTLKDIKKEGSNIHFLIESTISSQLKVDQSVAHDGVCLTVTQLENNSHWVTAVAETLQKTNLTNWKKECSINLERALKLGDRLDGHIVQGHVDTVGKCIKKEEQEGSYLFRLQFPKKFAALIIEKGSICLNGVSLTVFDTGEDTFTVTIIPYTLENTSFKQLEAGHAINMEFDLLGKYLLRQQSLNLQK